VEKQSFRDFEHIFVDGYSKDSTKRIIRNYTKRNEDINIKLIESEPKGISHAMNLGIEASRGEIIHIIHSDDYYWDENALESVSHYFQDNPKVRWLIGNRIYLAKGRIIRIRLGDVYKKRGNKIIKFLNWIPHASTFIKKELYNEHGLYKEDLFLTMDYEYWVRILDKEDPLIVREDLAVFRRHREGTSSKINNLGELSKEILYLKNVYKFIDDIKEKIVIKV